MSKSQNTRTKIFGLKKKILLVTIPLLVVSFVATAIIIFTSTGQSLLSNSKQVLISEAKANTMSVENSLLTATGSKYMVDAYRQLLLQPDKLDSVCNTVSNISIMDEGYMFMVNIASDNIIAHPDSAFVGTVLSDCEADSFLGLIAAQIAEKNTELFTVSDGFSEYYVILSYIDSTPYVLVSCIDQIHILSGLTSLLTNIALVFAGVMVLIIVLLTLFLQKTLKPINVLTDALTTITDGDFTVNVSTKGNDEISHMGSSLNNFVLIMRDIISDIRDISEQLDHSGKTTKQIAGSLNQSADAQADSMSDVKVTIDQVATGIQDLALHATTLSQVVDDTNQRGNDAKKSMQQTVEVATRGRSDMEDVNNAMGSIVDSMEQLEKLVANVGNSTEQINSMVEIISDISDQTNLLSLNAAIEAARAGEAGRGFAVVAEEIRKLAEVSASSAAQISDIITQVTSQVSYMVQQASQSVSYIKDNSVKITASCDIFERIYKNVTDADALLTEIVNQIAHVDDVATNIAALSEEQSASTEEILASTEVLANASLQFSEDSRQVAKSADDVAEASFALAEHMRKFKI